jgi:hypothetical protein
MKMMRLIFVLFILLALALARIARDNYLCEHKNHGHRVEGRKLNKKKKKKKGKGIT